jgi:hypothetical protein
MNTELVWKAVVNLTASCMEFVDSKIAAGFILLSHVAKIQTDVRRNYVQALKDGV